MANPKWWGIFAVAFAFAFGGVEAGAQLAKKIPQIGFLIGPSLSANAARLDALRQGLRELGYIEGNNILFEWRSADGKMGRLPSLARELVRLKVDVILSAGPTVTRAVKEATTTIPIIMVQDPDPVGNQFVASLARPDGNITGLSTLSPEISGKQLELLKEIIPRLSRAAGFGESTNPGSAQSLKEAERAAQALNVQFEFIDVKDLKAIEPSFRAVANKHVDAILVMGGPVLNSDRAQSVSLARKWRLPAIYNEQGFVEAGGLMTYSVSFNDLYRRAATYVDKILKGAKPADIPVEQPTKFEFVINLKAAKQIGLTIPPNVLARADRVIR
jgi:putative ABC transport system substrate-binding protein